MNAPTTIDLRPVAEIINTPFSLEAEQAVLGAIMFDNGAFERVEGLKPEHFYEGFHARLFAAIERSVRRDHAAEAYLLWEQLKDDPSLIELGGLRYMGMLVEAAPAATVARDYARLITEMARRRAVIEIGEDAAAEARHGDPENAVSDQIERIEQRLFELAENGKTQSGFQGFAASLAGAVELAAEAYGRDGGLSGVSTGLLDLDQKLGGLHPSDLIILAARPSMGKSALATNIAFNIAKNYAYEIQPDGTRKTTNGGVVGFFSLEMSAEQLAMRLLAEVSGVPSDRIRKGKITAAEFGRIRDAVADIESAPLHIDDTGGLSIAKLTARARRLKRTAGLDLIVVDYLQLVTASHTKRGDNRVQEVSEITQALKALAKDLGVPVIALSQLSRAVESRDDKRPMLADLRESGSIEQDADIVMFIYREAYYLGRVEPREGTIQHDDWKEKMREAEGVAELIIGKQRHGPIGTVRAHFNEDLTRFSDLARDGQFGAVRTPYRGDD